MSVIEHEATELVALDSEAPHAGTDHLPVPAQRHAVQLGTVGGDNGLAVVEAAAVEATRLAQIINSRKLFVDIRGRKHVVVEGWTTLATIMGCLPVEASTEFDEETGAYTSTFELRRIADGSLLSRASAECGHSDDKPWNGRPRYARRSMAQTRATSKVCRIAFSWVMTLAGYEATPAEEMPGNGAVPAGNERQPPRPSQQPTTGAGRAAQQSTQAPAPQAPEVAPVPITDAQATTVRDLIAELESTLGKRKKLETTICAFYRVDCVESIPAASYEQCIRKLELRRQEVAA